MTHTNGQQQRPLTAIVCGGASGIGTSVVRKLVKKGFRVVIADFNEDGGNKVAQQLRDRGKDVSFVAVSIASSASVDKAFKQAVDILGVVDVAILTAGITGPTKESHLCDEAEVQQVIDIDLMGAWRFSSAAIKQFRSQEPRFVRHDQGSDIWQPVYERGSLVMIASSIGSVAQPMLAPYCAAKAGVINMTKALALENASHLIRVNCISPGITLTPLLTSDPSYDFEFAKKNYLRDQPVGRFGHPDEIAAVIVHVALMNFMSGSDIGVDGAYQTA